MCIGRGIIQVGKGMNRPVSSPCTKCRFYFFAPPIGLFDWMSVAFNKWNNADECLYRQCAGNMNFPFLLCPATPYHEHCLCHNEKKNEVITVIIDYLWAKHSGLSDWLHKMRYSVACEDPLAYTVSRLLLVYNERSCDYWRRFSLAMAFGGR